MDIFDDESAFTAASLSARAMPTRPAIYLDGLNPPQREAVETLDGPVLMLAGAGTGKTRALMARIAHLVTTRTAFPNEILAVTFTNKAAREMKNRLSNTPYNQKETIRWMGTFHSICAKLLRRHAELAGLKSNFTILDTDDQLRLIKQVLEPMEVDVKRWPPRFFASKIDDWKNRAFTPERVPKTEDFQAECQRFYDLDEVSSNDQVRHFKHRNPHSNAIGRHVVHGSEVYAKYQRRLRDLNATDFGDLLLHVVTIFQKHPDVLQQYQRWFRYILVDEYQDTNVAQYLWLRLLAQGHKNICCVGDDDQSIYGWRGAEVGNILRFDKDFPGAKVIRLEQNYRSTEHILAAATGIISGNSNRLGKTLWTAAKGGEKVRLIGHWDGDEEARWVGDEIEAMQRGTRHMDPISANGMAILVRASHQMRAFEDRFLTIGLPYRVIGGPRFYERMEIRDAMAYFRLVVSPADDLAFERVVNTPKRGLGNMAQQKIHTAARDNGVSLLDGARILLEAKGLTGKGAKELQRFVDGLDRWREMMMRPMRAASPASDVLEEDAPAGMMPGDAGTMPGDAPVGTMSHIELAEIILDDSGYTTMWQNDKTPEAPGRLENLKELVKALEGFENLQGFLEHVSLIMDNESEGSEEKVTLMTLHAAKGLEFPAVFLPGWEDGLFPSQRTMDESGQKGLEEERRLAYVGITRAEEVCTISFTGNRRVYGQWQNQMPSRFIDELPVAHVDILTPPGIYGHQGGAGTGGTGAMPGSDLQQKASRADVYNSPGWRRLQANQATRGVSQPRKAKNVIMDAETVSAFEIGARVFHTKFGYGRVEGVEGNKLEIAFDKAGIKNVIARFLVDAAAADDVPF